MAGARAGIILGEWPDFSWNGEKPVDAFREFMIAKRTQGSEACHPF
jgi:hypothetical protein